jgi:hypothetical protein
MFLPVLLLFLFVIVVTDERMPDVRSERRLLESHFIELPDPCSVHSLARIQHEGRLKALVASNRSLYCTQIVRPLLLLISLHRIDIHTISC